MIFLEWFQSLFCCLQLTPVGPAGRLGDEAALSSNKQAGKFFVCKCVFGDEMEDVYLWGCLRTTVCQRNTHTVLFPAWYSFPLFTHYSCREQMHGATMWKRGKCERMGHSLRTRSSSTPWRFTLSFSSAKNMTCRISSALISLLPLIECGPEQDGIICACAWNKHGPFTNTHRPSIIHPGLGFDICYWYIISPLGKRVTCLTGWISNMVPKSNTWLKNGS